MLAGCLLGANCVFAGGKLWVSWGFACCKLGANLRTACGLLGVRWGIAGAVRWVVAEAVLLMLWLWLARWLWFVMGL